MLATAPGGRPAIIGVTLVTAALAAGGCAGTQTELDAPPAVAASTAESGAAVPPSGGPSSAVQGTATGTDDLWGAGGSTPSSLPSAPSGPADLTIVVDDGSGRRTTWTLTCDPAGGTHPQPEQACAVLGAAGGTALPPVSADTICSQQYGGPETATITGTWREATVSAEITLKDGCQIGRWTALRGLLPATGESGGVS